MGPRPARTAMDLAGGNSEISPEEVLADLRLRKVLSAWIPMSGQDIHLHVVA